MTPTEVGMVEINVGIILFIPGFVFFFPFHCHQHQQKNWSKVGGGESFPQPCPLMCCLPLMLELRERGKKRTAEIYAERKHILYYPFSKYGDQKPFGYCHITNITLLATRIIPFDCCLFLSYLSYSDERKGCVANSQSSWKNQMDFANNRKEKKLHRFSK